MVTVHWIKEPTPAKWELKSALIGFTWLNNAHNSKQLGQALFKIIEHVGLEHKISVFYIVNIPLHLSFAAKVSHITCDNASNNLTMMRELAVRLKINNLLTHGLVHSRYRQVQAGVDTCPGFIVYKLYKLILCKPTMVTSNYLID
jgi:hypothetical protein